MLEADGSNVMFKPLIDPSTGLIIGGCLQSNLGLKHIIC